MFDIY